MTACTPAAPVRWRDLLAPPHTGTVLALAAGVALHAVNLYVTATVLPNVVGDIGGLAQYAWVTTVFVIASIVAAALGARALGRLGPRHAYGIAAGALALGSAVCAGAPSVPVLLAGRLLQGLGGGLLVSMPYVLVRELLPQGLWTRALALLSGMWGIATLLGPAVGGAFAQYVSWRLAFVASVPAALCLGGVAWHVFTRRGPPGTAPALPLRQLALLAFAVLAASWGSSAAQAHHGAMAMAMAAALLWLLARLDARAAARLLPRVTYVSGSGLARLYALSALLAMTVTCTEVFVPLFLQHIQRLGPLAAGFVAASASAGWTLASVWSATQRDAQAVRCMRVAPWLCTVALLALAWLLPQPGSGAGGGIAVLTLALVMSGAGVGLAWPHLATAILDVAPGDDGELAAASVMTVQLVATTFGTAMGGLIVNAALRGDGGADMGRAALVLALFLATLPAVALLLVPGRGGRA